ncbi:hypothetical protein HDK77DRAFT_440991 [Phyllosticta capitalensis]|uniref:uncharacterized protein n=1 Tax=Phyllosticta capitalensis TaxID=121624 RepID=UPI00312D6C00
MNMNGPVGSPTTKWLAFFFSPSPLACLLFSLVHLPRFLVRSLVPGWLARLFLICLPGVGASMGGHAPQLLLLRFGYRDFRMCDPLWLPRSSSYRRHLTSHSIAALLPSMTEDMNLVEVAS